MLKLRRMTELPSNIAEFIDEATEGMTALYGEKSGHAYRSQARAQISSALQSPDLTAFAVFDGPRAVAILMAVLRDTVAYISYTHVLNDCTGQGHEERLIARAVESLRGGGVDAIISEHIAFCELDEADVYHRFGFTPVERVVMAAATSHPALQANTAPQSRALTIKDSHSAGAAIVDAYRNHPGRMIHGEVRSVEGAERTVISVLSGGFGDARPGFSRIIESGGISAGVLLGAASAPDVGFVVHVAVRASSQGQGRGTALLREAAAEFRTAGCEHVFLGVSLDNPALQLYERLGFCERRRVTSYAWWRP